MKNSLAIVTCVLAAAGIYWVIQAGSLEPPGPPAPTMVTLQGISDKVDSLGLGRIVIHPPVVIDAPGNYLIGSDYTASNSAECIIWIAANNVDLDLNGRTIDGGEYGNCICAQNVEQVAVYNGYLGSYLGYSVDFHDVAGFSIRDIVGWSYDDEAIIVTGNSGSIEGNRVLESQNGILVSGSDVIVRNNVSTEINVFGDRGIVGGNTIEPGWIGGRIQIEGNGNRVFDNTITVPGIGFSVSGDDNQVVGNITVSGIDVSGSDNQVVGNSVSELGVGGSGSLILNNIASNGTAGLSVGGSEHHIEGNLLTRATGYGLRFSSGSSGTVYRGNTVRGNGGSGCTGVSSGGDFCDEGTNNTSHGDNYMPGKM